MYFGCNNTRTNNGSHEYCVGERLKGANMLASQVMQGVAMNASSISIFAQFYEVLDLMFFHLQNVKETYTIAQQPFQLRDIQTWLNATLKCNMDCYSPLCFPYPRPHHLRIGKTFKA
jgi:hypothetical protein